MSPLRHRFVFGAKSAENGKLRKVCFFVSCVKCAAWASKFARFPPKTGSRCLPCSEIRFLPRKAREFQPAELVTADVTVYNTSACRGTPPILPGLTRPRDTAARRSSNRRCHRSLTRQPAEVPDRNRTSETSLRRTTPKPCHRRLLLPSQNVAQERSYREGLENLVDPASSHMLVSKPFLKRSRARFLPGPPLITLRVNNGTG